ncbi:MAG: NAD-dependent protein deacylase [Phycisphaerales bacterium]|nr:NAD-dependent protein deacylase [Phycisphaerales bacterium]
MTPLIRPASDAVTCTPAIDAIASARRLVSFSGAGLSAPSGVATFRDTAQGHWAKHDPMDLASPVGFARDPELVMTWYAMRRREMAAATPNAGHRALAAHPTMVHITQNTDDLLERAGATNVLHLHGTINAERCHGRCGWRSPIDLADPPGVQSCPGCGHHPSRPDVVWFGESLPQDIWTAAVDAIEQSDVLVVVGTSAVVHPAAGLIALARDHGASVIVVNTDASAADGLADHVLTGSADTLLPTLFPH